MLSTAWKAWQAQQLQSVLVFFFLNQANLILLLFNISKATTQNCMFISVTKKSFWQFLSDD